MLRSMYSGISGMKVNQTKLDVIGNNISNVGTTAFKGSRVTFSNMLSQSQSSAMAPSLNQGGVNGTQIGMGVQLSSIDRVMTQGMMQPTGRALDVAIDGEGFFMVSSGPVINGDGTISVDHRAGAHNMTSQSLATAGSQIMYSRDGAFTLDAEGNLLTKDGYRILGYSVTNDDNGQSATGKVPTSVSTSGLDFKFGPGSQLNGFKVVLGAVGPGTVTSSDVDKVNKTITVNGDFATVGALTSGQVEAAITKGLSAAGISQQVTVTGKPVNFSNLGSQGIKGGSDATSPNSVTVMGATFVFGQGDQLNDYVIKVGRVSDNKTTATVDTGNKEITINANFIENGAVTAAELGEAISIALRQSGITQEVSGTGIITQASGLRATSDEGGTEPKLPTNIDNNNIKIDFGTGTAPNNTKLSQLNGYTFEFKNDSTLTASPAVSVKMDKSSKTISVAFKSGSVTQDQIMNVINSELDNRGITDIKLNNIDLSAATIGDGSTVRVKTGTDGLDLVAPKNVTVSGLTVKLPKGTKFNNVEVKIADLDNNHPTDGLVQIVKKGTAPNESIAQIILYGDFRNQNVDSTTLENEINKAIEKSGIYGTTLNDDQMVSVTGVSKAIPGINSTAITGGQEYKAPENDSVFGLNFTFGQGAALNGYKINIGKIAEGTNTGVNIDEKSKTITINGDFVNSGAVSTAAIQSAINIALQDKGIEQNIRVSGNLVTLTGTESGITVGGTPIQSIDTDGAINFVDGAQDIKAYDGSLKTLKIPDKVKIPGTDTELRVKSYSIDGNGIINGVLEDGRVAALGQIAMASFKNPEGLQDLGGNLYGTSANSGDPVLKSGVGTLQDDNSGGYGDNLQGMLEMSNVDLAEQFTDMIVTTKAFQAAGKMITTGDEILQDIINLKR